MENSREMRIAQEIAEQRKRLKEYNFEQFSPQTIGERIKYIREQKKITQIKMAKDLGYPNAQTVSRWEKAKKSLSSDIVAQVSGYLGCSCDYLITGAEEKYRDASLNTGLSEHTLKFFERSPLFPKMVNELFSSVEGITLLLNILEIINGSYVSYYTEDNVRLDDSVLESIALTDIIKNISEYKRKVNGSGKT